MHFESNIQRAVESLADFREAHGGSRNAGSSYAGAVRASCAVAVPLVDTFGSPDERARRLLETIEVTPTGAMGEKLSDAQTTCNTVLSSNKPNKMGIKIDRVIKDRNKSVRIVAGHGEI